MLKFSVVIPLYNGAKFIETTLDSVLAQTYKDYEIVLVNDGSPDNVGEVVKKYIADHPQVKFVYVEQENRGLGGARNTAIRHASGDIIAILDQDDRWYPQKLEKVAEIFDKHPDVDVVCHNFYVLKNGKISVVYLTGPDDTDLHRKMLFYGNRLATLSTCFKRTVIDKVGFFTEDVKNLHFVEDYDLWLRMALAGCKFYFIPDFLAEYLQHEGNYSLTSIERMYRSELYAVDLHYRKLTQKYFFDWYRLRRRKARRSFVAAYSFFKAGLAAKGINYLMIAFKYDPLFIFYLFPKIVQKIHKNLAKGDSK